MIVGVGSDHKGFKLKEEVISFLEMFGFEVVDFGTNSEEECDFPKFAYLVSKAVVSMQVNRGILISESGIGMCIAANKIKGVKAARCANWKDAKISREISATNVLCLDDDADINLILEAWFGTEFDAENNLKHVNQIDQIEKVE